MGSFKALALGTISRINRPLTLYKHGITIPNLCRLSIICIIYKIKCDINAHYLFQINIILDGQLVELSLLLCLPQTSDLFHYVLRCGRRQILHFALLDVLLSLSSDLLDLIV